MQNAAQRWDELVGFRNHHLERAIECSQLTIPSLIPDSSLYSSNNRQQDEKLPSLFQGMGARGVSNLSAKLLLALYPPNQPFFRLTLDRDQLMRYAEASGAELSDDFIAKVDEGLARQERSILQHMELIGARTVVFETLRHLVVGGNALMYVSPTGMSFFGLRSFCVDRDPEGNWTEIVVKEEVSWDQVPPSIRPDDWKEREVDFAEVYTHIEVKTEGDREQVEWRQEVEGVTVPGSTGRSPRDRCPWIPLRLHRVAGESYGRGLVEEVLGDLQSLESLMQAIVEGSLIIARDVTLVNPTGLTNPRDLQEAANGDVITGSPNDIGKLNNQDRPRDLSVAIQTAQLIERRLSFAFMLQEAMQRDAERVTAEEVRQMAEMLETTLGGIYSILSQELQQPLIARVVDVLALAGKLPGEMLDFVSPQITTGLDSIGRGNDRARLMQFLQLLAGTMGPEALAQYLNPTELISRLAASDGIDTKGLIKTEEQMQQEAARMQEVQLQQQLVASQLNGRSGTARTGGGTPQA